MLFVCEDNRRFPGRTPTHAHMRADSRMSENPCNSDNCIDMHISYHGYFTPTHSIKFVVVRGKRDLPLKAAEPGQGSGVLQSQDRCLLPALLTVRTELRWE